MKRLLMLGSGSYLSTLSIRLRDLARHVGSDWDVTVMVPSADKYNNFTPNRSLHPRGITLKQPWQLRTRSPLVNLVPYLLSSLVTILRAKPEVVYLYKPTPITILGLLPKLLRHTPVFVDLDDLGSEVMRLEGQPRLMSGLVAWCERLAIRHADAVIVASSFLRAEVLKLHPDKRVLLLPNGVEPDDYRPVRPSKPRHGVYYFGAVNRLDLIEDLLRAVPAVLAQVPDVQVAIVGDGVALPAAKQLVKELGVKQAVIFLGWQTDMTGVQRYTHFADIGVCYQPDGRTIRAASNMKVFQYMAMRTVPLVSDVGDLHSYVKDGQAGVVVPASNVPALGTALVELLLDAGRRTELANNAYQLAQIDYAWHTRARAVSEFMASIMEDHA